MRSRFKIGKFTQSRNHSHLLPLSQRSRRGLCSTDSNEISNGPSCPCGKTFTLARVEVSPPSSPGRHGRLPRPRRERCWPGRHGFWPSLAAGAMLIIRWFCMFLRIPAELGLSVQPSAPQPAPGSCSEQARRSSHS